MGKKEIDVEEAFESRPRFNKRFLDEERRANRLPIKLADGSVSLPTENVAKSIPSTSTTAENPSVSDNVDLMTGKVKRRLQKEAQSKQERQAKKQKMLQEKKADPYNLNKLHSLAQKHNLIAETANKVMGDPIKHIDDLDILFSLYSHEKSNALLSQQIFLSLLNVIKDLLPNYKISGQRDAALEQSQQQGNVKLSKRVQGELLQDKNILQYYNRLHEIMKKDFLGKSESHLVFIGALAATTLLEAAPHFNRGQDLLKIVLNLTADASDKVSSLAEASLETLLTRDLDLSLSVEVVRYLGDIGKRSPGLLSEKALGVISRLNLGDRRGQADRELGKIKELKKVEEKMQQDILQGSVFNPLHYRKNETSFLTEALILYMRVIRSPRSYRLGVIEAVLKGVVGHSIMINVDLLVEMLELLLKIAKPGEEKKGEEKKTDYPLYIRMIAFGSWIQLSKIAWKKSESNILSTLDPYMLSEVYGSLLKECCVVYVEMMREGEDREKVEKEVFASEKELQREIVNLILNEENSSTFLMEWESRREREKKKKKDGSLLKDLFEQKSLTFFGKPCVAPSSLLYALYSNFVHPSLYSHIHKHVNALLPQETDAAPATVVAEKDKEKDGKKEGKKEGKKGGKKEEESKEIEEVNGEKIEERFSKMKKHLVSVKKIVDITSDILEAIVLLRSDIHVASVGKMFGNIIKAVAILPTAFSESLIQSALRFALKQGKILSILEEDGVIVSSLDPAISIHSLVSLLLRHKDPAIVNAIKALNKLREE